VANRYPGWSESHPGYFSTFEGENVSSSDEAIEHAGLQHGLDMYNEENPPAFSPPPLLANYRHLCTKARQAKATGKGVSTAIDLKEKYVFGWSMEGDTIKPILEGDGEWAIVYREGSCKSCKLVARSKSGRIVRTDERPPAQGRVARD
jgi:transposase InsO family protein